MKIVAVSQNQHNLDELRRLLVADAGALETTFFMGGIAQAESAVSHMQPNLLIFDTSPVELNQMAGVELISLRHPHMAIILLSEVQSQEFLTEAMHIGVREVLPLPLAPQSLHDAIWRAQKRSVLQHTANHKGKALAFIACKGGSGATFLAVNLGYILAEALGKRVALLDLNLHFGNASLFVYDRNPINTVSDLCSNIQRLDSAFLASSMVHVLPNFSILAAPENPERATEVKAEHIDALIELALHHYDFVILDTSRELDAVNVRALDHAEMIFPVLQETLPFIRDAKRLLATFHSLGYDQEKIRLIVNRYEKGGDIRLEDVEHTLGMKVAQTIPNSFKAVSASVNQGVAILKIAPSDAVTKALTQLGKTLIEVPEEKPGGWFAHWFN